MDDMTTEGKLFLLALLGSAGLLAGALVFQYVVGLAPCPLCIWQRWPHVAVLVLGAGLALTGWRGFAALAGGAALTSAGIGVYHYGIEQKLWAGPASCTGGSLEGVSAADLLNPAANVGAVVRCDEVAWALMGISMPGWNVIASVSLALIWLVVWRRS